MKLPHVLVILSTVFSLVALDEVEDKEAKAIVLEAEPSAKSSGAQTKLFTSDATLNSAIAGVGIGVVGSLIVGALLDAKKDKCHPRYRRDTPSARFLGGGKCPPIGYHHPPPPVPYPNSGYPVPHATGSTGYNPNYAKPGYPAPNYHNSVPSSAYRPNNGYNNNNYNNGYSSTSSYNTPRPNYSSASNYRPSNTGYNSAAVGGGYQQQNFAPSNYPPSPIYNQNNGYGNTGYRSAASSSTGVASAAPSLFSGGIRSLPGAQKV